MKAPDPPGSDDAPARPGHPGSRPGADLDADAGEPATSDPRSSAKPSPPLVCELCGGPVLERHCKILCLNCGFQRDCSDP